MNPRIKKLAEQAGFVPGVMGLNRYTYFDPEKFAELIVEECVSRCWTVSEIEYKGNVISECSKRMRKHFGVE